MAALAASSCLTELADLFLQVRRHADVFLVRDPDDREGGSTAVPCRVKDALRTPGTLVSNQGSMKPTVRIALGRARGARGAVGGGLVGARAAAGR
jgi:hypothetical protein